MISGVRRSPLYTRPETMYCPEIVMWPAEERTRLEVMLTRAPWENENSSTRMKVTIA